MSKEEHGMMNADEVKELLEAFSEKIPALLNSLTDAIYGKDASAKFGAAVADFYKTLKESGMTDEQAFRLTEQYMSSLNIGGVDASGLGRGRKGGDGGRSAGTAGLASFSRDCPIEQRGFERSYGGARRDRSAP